MYILRLESDFFRNPPSMTLYITKFITWGWTFDMYIEVFQVFCGMAAGSQYRFKYIDINLFCFAVAK